MALAYKRILFLYEQKKAIPSFTCAEHLAVVYQDGSNSVEMVYLYRRRYQVIATYHLAAGQI
jgi:hypothetical protein